MIIDAARSMNLPESDQSFKDQLPTDKYPLFSDLREKLQALSLNKLISSEASAEIIQINQRELAELLSFSALPTLMEFFSNYIQQLSLHQLDQTGKLVHYSSREEKIKVLQAMIGNNQKNQAAVIESEFSRFASRIWSAAASQGKQLPFLNDLLDLYLHQEKQTAIVGLGLPLITQPLGGRDAVGVNLIFDAKALSGALRGWTVLNLEAFVLDPVEQKTTLPPLLKDPLVKPPNIPGDLWDGEDQKLSVHTRTDAFLSGTQKGWAAIDLPRTNPKIRSTDSIEIYLRLKPFKPDAAVVLTLRKKTQESENYMLVQSASVLSSRQSAMGAALATGLENSLLP